MENTHGFRGGPGGLEEQDHLDEHEISIKEADPRHDGELARPYQFHFVDKGERMIVKSEHCMGIFSR